MHCPQPSQALLSGPPGYSSLADVWQDPLKCIAVGWGVAYLVASMSMIFFCKILRKTKVYGPSLAMTDNWEDHITQLGLTKTVHEYVIYQLLSTAEGWTAWREFLPEQFADQTIAAHASNSPN